MRLGGEAEPEGAEEGVEIGEVGVMGVVMLEHLAEEDVAEDVVLITQRINQLMLDQTAPPIQMPILISLNASGAMGSIHLITAR